MQKISLLYDKMFVFWSELAVFLFWQNNIKLNVV